MRRPGRLMVALLVALVAPGCTSLGALTGDGPVQVDDAPGGEPFAPAPSWSASPDAAAAASAGRAPGPGVELSLSESWVKPRHAVQASAASPSGRVDWGWFVATNTTSVDFARIATLDYLRGGEWQSEPGRSRVSTGLLPPGTGSPDVLLGSREGIYEFRTPRHPDAVFTVEAAAGVALERVEVGLVRDAAGFRFEPASATVATGGRVRFVNADAVPHSVQEREFLLRLPDRGPAVDLVGVETGWYVVAVRARGDDGGESWAQRALLVDFESPTSRVELGPYEGRFGPTLGARTYRFEAAHELREIALALDVRGTVPALPPAVRVSLLHEGQVVDAREVEARAEWRLEALPPGQYALVLEPGAETLAAYTLAGTLAYAPAMPEAPAWVQERLGP